MRSIAGWGWLPHKQLPWSSLHDPHPHPPQGGGGPKRRSRQRISPKLPTPPDCLIPPPCGEGCDAKHRRVGVAAAQTTSVEFAARPPPLPSPQGGGGF